MSTKESFDHNLEVCYDLERISELEAVTSVWGYGMFA
jgi:hypothetical protein